MNRKWNQIVLEKRGRDVDYSCIFCCQKSTGLMPHYYNDEKVSKFTTEFFGLPSFILYSAWIFWIIQIIISIIIIQAFSI